MSESMANRMMSILKAFEGLERVLKVELKTGRIVCGRVTRVEDGVVIINHGVSNAEEMTTFPGECIVSFTIPK